MSHVPEARVALIDLGYDVWFEDQMTQMGQPGCRPARVVAADKGRYLVRDAERCAPAELSGRLSYCAQSAAELPCVGDWVAAEFHDVVPHGVIHRVLERRSVLRRKAAGKRIDYQYMAANVDVAFVLQSCAGDFNLRRLERYVVVARDGNIQPVLILSKTDLVSPGDLESLVARVREGYGELPVVALSNVSADGLDGLLHVLAPRKTYCLLGSSGVGKTTLLNRLVGREEFATGEVREQDGRGRHTTSRRQLVSLDNGAMIIDTPGMRELGIIGAATGLEEGFEDIGRLAAGCRYADCTHTGEEGCAVLDAVNAGQLSEERYQGFLKVKKESEFLERSYVQRRRKDKEFGKMVKSVLKHGPQGKRR